MSAQRTLAASVLVPVRDRWDELERCVAAFAVQDVDVPGGAEVVLIDDGGRDVVGRVRCPDAGQVSVRLLRQERRGRSEARNAGVVAARGELLVFVDSDSVVDPGFLRAMVEAAETHPIAIAFQGNLRVDATKWVWRAEGWTRDRNPKGRHVCGPMVGSTTSTPVAVAVRRTYAASFDALFDPRAVRGEDTLILCRLRSDGHLPTFVEKATAVHRPRGSVPAYVLRHFEIGFRDASARGRLAAEGRLLSPVGCESYVNWCAYADWYQAGAVVGVTVLIAYGIEVSGRCAGGAACWASVVPCAVSRARWAIQAMDSSKGCRASREAARRCRSRRRRHHPLDDQGEAVKARSTAHHTVGAWRHLLGDPRPRSVMHSLTRRQSADRTR